MKADVHVASPHHPGLSSCSASQVLRLHDAAQQRMWDLDLPRTLSRTGNGKAREGVDPRDVLTVLATAAAAAERLLALRWCYVRDGLAAGLSLSELATATGMRYSDDLVAGYRAWVTGQQELHGQHPWLGMSEAAADEALALLVAAPRWTGMQEASGHSA